MAPWSPRGLVGLGVGVGLAVSSTAVGVVAERVNRRRGEALETGADLVAVPTREVAVVTGDGVPLHVEIDDPVDGASTHVQVNGVSQPRPTVVLTHGYCLTSECWVFQRRALTRAGYRVVVWDQRGHGRSEKGDAASCTLEQVGDDLARVIANVVPDGPLLLGGHSMGGMTMLALAESHPGLVRERVVAAAFVATSAGGALASADLTARVARSLMERLAPGAVALLADRPQLLQTLRRANRDLADLVVERYCFASPVPHRIVRLAGRMLLGVDLRVMSSFAPVFDDYDKVAALGAYDGAQVLVFNGENDILTPPSHSQAIVAAVPGTQHVVLRQAGHIIMLEHPEVLSQQLVALGERAVRAPAPPTATHRLPTLQVVTDVGKRRRIEQARVERRPQRAR
ncbi:alpha/beta hydrolase [Dermatophilaceae bacterium Soc4.6]